MTSSFQFKRMLLGLPHSPRDFASVTFTAELAERLGLELVAIFAQDETLSELAQLPFLREFRISEGGWHRIDAELMAKASDRAEIHAREMFSKAVQSASIATRFTFAKDESGDALADDIIVVIEPKNPAERITHQFKQMMTRAFEAQAAALLIPSRIERHKGPVAAIVTHERDTSIQAAAQIARRGQHKLIVLALEKIDSRVIEMQIRSAETTAEFRPIRGEFASAEALLRLLAPVGESLLVVSRSPAISLTPELVFECGVPVLLTDG